MDHKRPKFVSHPKIIYDYYQICTLEEEVMTAMYDVAIIGAGPAGASAAIYTARADKKTVVIDNDKSITKRALLLNYYAVSEMTGPEMFDKGIEQLTQFGAQFMKETAQSVKRTDSGFLIETDTQQIEAKHVIIATGMQTDLAEQLGAVIKDHPEPRMKSMVEVDAEGKTNVPGLWAAGTAAGVSVHAIITAGDGAKVAINVISELNGERYVDHDIYKG